MNETNQDRGDWLQTYTGRIFYPLAPEPEDVCLSDIAHALSMQCRFTGHTKVFYSVAEHSVRVSLIVPREHALVGLLHDAAEAYVVDVPSPIKGMIPAFKDAERVVARAVGERFGVDLVTLPPEVKEADLILLATEQRDLMAPPPQPWRGMPAPLLETIVPWTPRRAELEFLDRFVGLFGEKELTS